MHLVSPPPEFWQHEGVKAPMTPRHLASERTRSKAGVQSEPGCESLSDKVALPSSLPTPRRKGEERSQHRTEPLKTLALSFRFCNSKKKKNVELSFCCEMLWFNYGHEGRRNVGASTEELVWGR